MSCQIQHSTDEGTTPNCITEYSTANKGSKTKTPIPNKETSDLTRETVKGNSKSTISFDNDSSTTASPLTANEVRKFVNHSFPVHAKV